MNVAIGRKIARVVTSPRLREARISLSRLGRRLTDHVRVHYFHQVDDPYSHLTAQILSTLVQRYRIELMVHLVPATASNDSADQAQVQARARRDATALARHYQLEAPLRTNDLGEVFDEQPTAELIRLAMQALTSAVVQDRFALIAPDISRALWQNHLAPLTVFASNTDPGAPAAALRLGANKQKRLGLDQAASFYFASEWYLGIERLHYLEERLRAEGLATEPLQALIVPPTALPLTSEPAMTSPALQVPQLHFFGSFRSPYSYLALHRAKTVAEHYGALLQLHFVIPLAMHGQAIPRARRLYIMRDAKREADRWQIPFGKITDPIGAPVERGLAVLHRAIAQGCGVEFALSFFQGAWGEGINAGSDRGLNTIAARAGMDAASVKAALADDSWRASVQSDQELLASLGHWDVPCLRVNDGPVLFGHERFWLLEQELAALTRQLA